jgi:hypothetical protein
VILYLYALAEDIERVADVTGVCGEPLVLIAQRGCTLVAGWIEERPVIDRDSLTRQDAAVRRIHHLARAVLPVRFGTAVADIEAATRRVGMFGPAIRERFDLVRDREQMTLRAGASSASGASPTSNTSQDSGAGRRYLERLAAQRMPMEIQPLVDALKPLSRATRVERSRRTEMVTVYQLIDRGAGAAFRDAANRAAADVPALKVRISGPSPAYAFADVGPLR